MGTRLFFRKISFFAILESKERTVLKNQIVFILGEREGNTKKIARFFFDEPKVFFFCSSLALGWRICMFGQSQRRYKRCVWAKTFFLSFLFSLFVQGKLGVSPFLEKERKKKEKTNTTGVWERVTLWHWPTIRTSTSRLPSQLALAAGERKWRFLLFLF